MTNSFRKKGFCGRLGVLTAGFAFATMLCEGSAAAEIETRDADETDNTIAAESHEETTSGKPAEPKSAPRETFLDVLNVTATRTERTLRDTPGQVDIIDLQEIEERGYTGIEDLVRYLPGVDVDGDPTRLGTSGFIIRGVGGNRVLTEIDGVPTAERFDFGPFSVHQYAVDVDALESVEIVRSAGSALYGSDALGGVVALTTRDPRSYLGGERTYFGLRTGFDGRNDEFSHSGTAAVGNDRWQASLLATRRDGSDADNQGTIDTRDSTRTRPNPIDREQTNLLGQVSFTPNDHSVLRGSLEWFDTETETDILSSIRGGSPFATGVREADGLDTQDRTRFSLDQSVTSQSAAFDTVFWRAYVQDTFTEQLTFEIREPELGLSDRDGLLSFDQVTLGARAEFRKAIGKTGLLTYGATYLLDRFDQFRDRTEFVIDTGEPVPTSLVFPTKYSPETDVEEFGLFLQTELELLDGRLSLVPGLRFDRYDLDADQNDAIFLDGNPGSLPPVDLTEEKVSPKLGLVASLTDEFSFFAQYARGFRAPPMSDVNNGFTNQAGGYRTLPNPDLQPETSDNFELGFRGVFRRASFSITGFDNQYDDFIDSVFLGFNPMIFLIEFQPQNVDNVEIRGLELAAEAQFGSAFQVRGAYAYTEGTNETTDQPLASIAPAQLVLGLRYAPAGGRWGAELIGTATASKDESDLPDDSEQFRVPSSEVLDLVGWFSLTDRWRLQVSAWNLSDETYWPWPSARILTEGSPTLDRFTSPGRSFGAQLRYVF